MHAFFGRWRASDWNVSGCRLFLLGSCLMNESKNKLTIGVVANVSAGKTTLINALLGDDILLSRNAACTQTVYKISLKKTRHVKGKFPGQKYQNITQYLLENWNVSDFPQIDIKAEPYNTALKNKNIIIYDTPGNNDNINKKAASLAHFGLSRKRLDMLICILDYRCPGSNDERKMLNAVKKIYTSRRKKIKIIFFLNQIDNFRSHDRTLVKQIQNVKKRLHKAGFDDYQLLYGMAQETLLLRMYIQNKLNDPYEQIELKRQVEIHDKLIPQIKKLYKMDSFKLPTIACSGGDSHIPSAQSEQNDISFLHYLELLTGISTLENIILKEVENVN